MSAIRWPARATPIVRLGSNSICSASHTTSGSIPDEANNRSMTGPRGSLEPRESHGGQAPHGVLLDNGLDAVAVCAKFADQGFRFCVARQGHCQIGVSREPRFRTRRNGQTANQGEGDAGFNEVNVDLA